MEKLLLLIPIGILLYLLVLLMLEIQQLFFDLAMKLAG